MQLLKLSERRNEMHQQQKSILDSMDVPYSLVKEWIETERNYQIHLANIEASKQARIIKELSKEIKYLKRGVKS